MLGPEWNPEFKDALVIEEGWSLCRNMGGEVCIWHNPCHARVVYFDGVLACSGARCGISAPQAVEDFGLFVGAVLNLKRN